ncbi:MAG: hypothetical protein ACM3N5_02710 [Candidatus Eiseniibacteriota bacterium]
MRLRWRPTSAIWRLSLLFIVATFSTRCTTASYSGPCPPWPAAGPEVAAELEAFSYEGHEDFWNWMARLDTLKQQLDRCRAAP